HGGRVLVFVNLILALGMGVWAFGLYSGRIDWSDNPAKQTQPPGELTKRQATLKDLSNALTVAETRQRAAVGHLRLFEQRRPRDTTFFAQHLGLLQNGINDKNPLVIVGVVNGLIQVTPAMLPVMVAPPKE